MESKHQPTIWLLLVAVLLVSVAFLVGFNPSIHPQPCLNDSDLGVIIRCSSVGVTTYNTEPHHDWLTLQGPYLLVEAGIGFLLVAVLTILSRGNPPEFLTIRLPISKWSGAILMGASFVLAGLFIVYILANVSFAFTTHPILWVGITWLSFGLPSNIWFGALAFLAFSGASLLMFLALSNRGIWKAFRTTVAFYSAPMILCLIILLILFDFNELWEQVANFTSWIRIGGYSYMSKGVIYTVYGVPILSNVLVGIVSAYLFIAGLWHRP